MFGWVTEILNYFKKYVLVVSRGSFATRDFLAFPKISAQRSAHYFFAKFHFDRFSSLYSRKKER